MQRVDELVLLFLKATGRDEECRLLDQIVTEHARPLISQIIRSRLRISADGSSHSYAWQDLDDMVAEVVLQIVKRMTEMKSGGRNLPVSDLTNYVAVAAHNEFNTYLRRKHPERWRLKDKLRYVLAYQKGFSLWENESGRWLCGFELWRERSAPVTGAGRLKELREDPAEREAVWPASESRREDLPKLVRAIFNWADGPIEFDDLVDVVGDLRSRGRGQRAAFEQLTGPQWLNEVPDGAPNMATLLEQRVYLEKLWLEIGLLPVGQRRALLLNLRDHTGHDMTALFAHTHIASLGELAAVLELKLEEFLKLSAELPMEDNVIGRLLGVTRQQVINLRASARRRLARRMKRLDRDVSGSFRD